MQSQEELPSTKPMEFDGLRKMLRGNNLLIVNSRSTSTVEEKGAKKEETVGLSEEKIKSSSPSAQYIKLGEQSAR
ncbi:UNVERIFIED_CONTAM: hypothetical protein K2H54_029023 [Gekko kuhli]